MVFFRTSKLYFLLKSVLFFAYRIYFRKLIIHGKENIPEEGPVIFAPNHQNALMDPLAIIFTNRRQISFLARADIFKKEWLSAILSRMKIIPVYRIRDGKESLRKNDEIFELCGDVLKHNQALALFPEGSHNDRRSLLPLRKAIPRIAFKVEAKNDFELGLVVIPVGINYSHYSNFRTDLLIEYGKPISLSDYQNQFSENEEKASRLFMKDMSDRIKPLMIHIEDSKNHQFYEYARQIYAVQYAARKECDLSDARIRRNLDQEIIEKLFLGLKSRPEEKERLIERIEHYFSELKALKIRSWIFDKPTNLMQIAAKALLLLLLFPVHVYGSVNNFVIYQFIKNFVDKRVKDVQFHATYKFGLGLVFIPLVIFIQTFIVDLMFSNSLINLAYIISLPLTGLFAFRYMIQYRKLKGVANFFVLSRSKNKRLTDLISLRTKLLTEIVAIVEA
ncbi:MAG: 1-acyl-sn-glycerol-3-phosphate acyltransferase [Bacteroidales bacterium]|nr:1-acyl-sn-glycerol-3-phosphate acyltransferase [Bacteroidales bacterium]